MARTTKKSTGRGSSAKADNQLAQAVVDSAQKIWLAGLGAFARAKNEGDKMFDTLVEQGRSLRGRARTAADEALRSARSQADATMSQAQGKWDKLEQVFEDRVSRSLGRLGVLTSKDVEALGRQVAELNESIRSLVGGAKARRGAAKKSSRARKPARKTG